MIKSQQKDPKMMTLPDAAAALQMDKHTIRYLIDRGRLVAARNIATGEVLGVYARGVQALHAEALEVRQRRQQAQERMVAWLEQQEARQYRGAGVP